MHYQYPQERVEQIKKSMLRKKIGVAPEHKVTITKISKNDTVFCEFSVTTKPLIIEHSLYNKSSKRTTKNRFFCVFSEVFSIDNAIFGDLPVNVS